MKRLIALLAIAVGIAGCSKSPSAADQAGLYSPPVAVRSEPANKVDEMLYWMENGTEKIEKINIYLNTKKQEVRIPCVQLEGSNTCIPMMLRHVEYRMDGKKIDEQTWNRERPKSFDRLSQCFQDKLTDEGICAAG